MPLCSLSLVSLSPSVSISSFVTSLQSSLTPPNQPLVVGKVVGWIIPPWVDQPTSPESTSLKQLQVTPWHLLIILPGSTELPEDIQAAIKERFTLRVGIPSSLTANFVERTNPSLLHPDPDSLPARSNTSPQLSTSTKDLELTSDLLKWINGTKSSNNSISNSSAPTGPVSMLNLLSFPQNDPNAKASYKKYGAAFAQNVGSRHGGVAKLVGNVIDSITPATPAEEVWMGDQIRTWDEIALAHYPTIRHFADMVGSKEYQEVNSRYRKESLRGTGILCCDELDEEVLAGMAMVGEGNKADGRSVVKTKAKM